MSVERAYEALFERWARYPKEMTWREHDPEWPSPCVTTAPDANGMVAWRPVLRNEPADLSPLADALGAPIPEAWAVLPRTRYFGHIESWLDFERERWAVILLSAWNDEDLGRLLQGQVAHVHGQRGVRGCTLYIGGTDGDPFFSLDVETGAVLLEDFGAPPRIVAPSFESLLDALMP